jgi:hypothetical protein
MEGKDIQQSLHLRIWLHELLKSSSFLAQSYLLVFRFDPSPLFILMLNMAQRQPDLEDIWSSAYTNVLSGAPEI